MISGYKKTLGEKGEVYLRAKINPSASKNQFRDIMQSEEGDVLKIDIAAQPEKGKANQELIRFLAKEFGVLKTNIKILSGAGDRIKLIKIIK